MHLREEQRCTFGITGNYCWYQPAGWCLFQTLNKHVCNFRFKFCSMVSLLSKRGGILDTALLANNTDANGISPR